MDKAPGKDVKRVNIRERDSFFEKEEEKISHPGQPSDPPAVFFRYLTLLIKYSREWALSIGVFRVFFRRG